MFWQDHGKKRREKREERRRRRRVVHERRGVFYMCSCIRHRGMQKCSLEWVPPPSPFPYPFCSTSGQRAAVVCRRISCTAYWGMIGNQVICTTVLHRAAHSSKQATDYSRGIECQANQLIS